jgi:hypothetical protein
MSLKIVGKDVASIKKALQFLAEERFDSNCHGEIEGDISYDYDFLDSNDVFSDDFYQKVIDPYSATVNQKGSLTKACK